MAMPNDFAVFILSYARPNNVITYRTLKKQGYTGKTYIIIDNEDSTGDEYRKNFGNKVIVYNLQEIAKQFDNGDNFPHRGVPYARNACHDIAAGLGIKNFLVLDDDYTDFIYKTTRDNGTYVIKKIDSIFSFLLNFYRSIRAISIAIAQNGDFIGGKDSGMFTTPTYRKCMNTFFCSTERRFQFIGRRNEDVNTYLRLGELGNLFLTIIEVAIHQVQTQKIKGGMSEMYRQEGTYVKSFYSVMFCPSCVRVRYLTQMSRIHHFISWKNAVPCIIPEKHKKPCGHEFSAA